MDSEELALTHEMADSLKLTDEFILNLLLKEARNSVAFDVAFRNDEVIFELDETTKAMLTRAVELSFKRYLDSKSVKELELVYGSDEIEARVASLKPGAVFIETDSSNSTFKFIKLFDGQVLLENSNGLPMDYGTPSEFAFIEILHDPKD